MTLPGGMGLGMTPPPERKNKSKALSNKNGLKNTSQTPTFLQVDYNEARSISRKSDELYESIKRDLVDRQRRTSLSVEPPVTFDFESTTSSPAFRFDDLSTPINNGITNAPSRLGFEEPNVYPSGLLAPPTHVKKRKRRSKTPETTTIASTHGSYDSILSRLDCSIRSQFGDWTDMDLDAEFYHPTLSHSRSFNGKSGSDSYPGNRVNLPRLYKSYDVVCNGQETTKHNGIKGHGMTVVTTTHQQLSLSKDNDDPNSILSQAKRTLTQVGTVHVEFK